MLENKGLCLHNHVIQLTKLKYTADGVGQNYFNIR